MAELRQETSTKTEEIRCLHAELDRLHCDPDVDQNERLKAEIRELREELSDMSLNEYGNIEPGRRTQNSCADSLEDVEIRRLNGTSAEESCCSEADKLREEMDVKAKYFEKERIVWAQEKEKVLR